MDVNVCLCLSKVVVVCRWLLLVVNGLNVCPNVCPFYLLYICFVPEDLKSEVMWSWVCKIQT